MSAHLSNEPLIELRTYRAKPGEGSALVAMFEAIFMDTYEQEGAIILGSFIDLAAHDRWVWLRAFEGPEERGQVLAQFYSSEVWRQHAKACNALIEKVESARLLSCIGPYPAFDQAAERPVTRTWQLSLAPLGKLSRPSSAQGLHYRTATGENFYPRQRVLKSPVEVLLEPLDTPQAQSLARSSTLLSPTPRSRLR